MTDDKKEKPFTFFEWVKKFPKNPNTETAKARLYKRLRANKLRVRPVPLDGNCQFTSVADQLFNDLTQHSDVRSNAVGWLRANPTYKGPHGEVNLTAFIGPSAWEEYLKKMDQDGTWGDHLTLIAISQVYEVEILIVSSNWAKPYITHIGEGEKTIRIAHYAEWHFESIERIPEKKGEESTILPGFSLTCFVDSLGNFCCGHLCKFEEYHIIGTQQSQPTCV